LPDVLVDDGLVLTGVDRPDVGGEELTFFGRKVRLPVGHARMALRTGAKIVVGVVQRVSGGYHVTGPRIIEPIRSGDTRRDVLQLAQHVIDILAGYIRERPEEWMMFLPVWPGEIPTASPR
jgi:lauroyl/myristoyl acyltransferase